MKKQLLYWLSATLFFAVLGGCGGDEETGGGSGTLSIEITDAKSVLPNGTEEILVTFEEVYVHQPKGGGWQTCNLIESPYTVDLLQLNSGNTAVLVPPCALSPGKYTQIRIVITHAEIVINGINYDLGVPSQTLKTDKNFIFDVENGGFVALTIDFDPGLSIVGTVPDLSLKPVLHIVRSRNAATICGSLAAATFGDPAEQAIITVNWDEDSDGTDEIYTQLAAEKEFDTDPTDFCVFWLDPQKDFEVLVDVGETNVLDETILSTDLSPGETFLLNEGNQIEIP